MRLGTTNGKNPWAWVPSSYIAMGIPFAMVIWVAGTMFKDLGRSDTEITVATASIGIAWSLKPLWAGFLDIFKTKKFFAVAMEFVMVLLLGAMASALSLDGYFGAIVGLMWLLAFASSTQDICMDGIYIDSLDKNKQAAFIGVQGMAWNLGRIVAVSAVVWLAGYLQEDVGLHPKTAWMYAIWSSAGLMATLGVYHSVVLPTGSASGGERVNTVGDALRSFVVSAGAFFDKRALWGMLAFVFCYRSAEGLLLVEAPLFMQSCLEDGGLQLSLQDKGTIDGTVSTVVSIAGGLLGGAFITRFTLKRTLFLLAMCVNVPNAAYLYLSHFAGPANPLGYAEIAFIVSLEKFWYGFGFVGNMLYMMQQLAPGKFKMTHYAFATALMNLALVPTQMASGPLADWLGFREYFWFVMVAAIPSLVAAWFAPFPQDTGHVRGTGVDDDAFLDEDDRRMQEFARRASIFSLLGVLLFLVVDVLLLGWLSGAQGAVALTGLLVLLMASAAGKFVLGAIGMARGRAAMAAARRLPGGSAYLGNARGAVVVGAMTWIIALAMSGFAVHRAASIDWACAGSDGPDACTGREAPRPESRRQCANPDPR